MVSGIKSGLSPGGYHGGGDRVRRFKYVTSVFCRVEKPTVARVSAVSKNTALREGNGLIIRWTQHIRLIWENLENFAMTTNFGNFEDIKTPEISEMFINFRHIFVPFNRIEQHLHREI